MAPPGINNALTILLIIGFGIYFAWGLIKEAQRTMSGHKWLVRSEAIFLSNILVSVMMLVSLLMAWRYGTWQPVWVLGSIAIVLGVAIRIWVKW